MQEVNFEGLSVLVGIFKEILSNPTWITAFLLYFGAVLVAMSAIIRFLIYIILIQVGADYDRAKAGSVFWKTLFFAGLIYLAYVFLFQSFFPPDMGLLGDLLATLPKPL